MISLHDSILATMKDYPDFPKPGVIFKDMCPVLRNPALLKQVIRAMAEEAQCAEAQQIIGIESRGFILGVPVALELGIPFVPARKKGKLPGRVITQEYALEYGKDSIEIQTEALSPGQRNFIVDDVIATGGTAAAVIKVVQQQSAVMAGCLFLMELTFLKGRAKLLAQAPQAHIHSLIVLD